MCACVDILLSIFPVKKFTKNRLRTKKKNYKSRKVDKKKVFFCFFFSLFKLDSFRKQNKNNLIKNVIKKKEPIELLYTRFFCMFSLRL